MKKIRVTMQGRTLEAELAVASENRKSLYLTFDGALRTKDGGMYVGSVALLWDDGVGAYVDLATGTPAEVEWQ